MSAVQPQGAAAAPDTGRSARVEARRRRKREALLDAAQELLVRQGAHALSLRAVARAAGHAPSSLYEYFANREALLDALADRPRTELHAYLAAAESDSTGMAGDLLVRLGLAYVRFARRRPDGFRLVFEALAPGRQDLEQPSPFEVYPVLRPLLSAARTGQATGEIHASDDPERIAWGLWAIAHGLATLRAGAFSAQGDEADSIDTSVLQAYVGGWLA